jgi:drug/metabolite transporter (DMT)-like permease
VRKILPIVYPVARALFIAIIDVTRGRYLTLAGWMGIILVVMGSALMPQRNFWDFQLRNYLDRDGFWMLIAALGIVGYTFLDKIAAEVVRSGPETAARCGYFYFAISFFPNMLLLRSVRTTLENRQNSGWK